MKSSKQQWEHFDHLILVAGHAVYVGNDRQAASNDESWVLQDFQKGEPPCYIEHIRFGVELAASQPKSLLVFSGGQTRLEAGPRSEAQSYSLLADQFAWWQKTGVKNRATTEEFARDSFENLLFSIARFRECTGHYPQSIEVVSWPFKRERFDLHRQTIRWPGNPHRYKFHGGNNPNDLERSLRGEAKTLASFNEDPFGTEEQLRSKREQRNPFHQTPQYSETCPEIAGLLNHRTAAARAFKQILPWNIDSTEIMGEFIADSLAQLNQLVMAAQDILAQSDSERPEFWYRGHDRGIYTLTPTLLRYEEPEKKEPILFDKYAVNVGRIAAQGPSSWARVAWMQHYGIPTRLLDWTTELNHAVFFAVQFLVRNSREKEPRDDKPCIYILNPARLNKKNEIPGVPRVPRNDFPDFDYHFSKGARKPLEYPLAVAPVDLTLDLNERLTAQRGCFTVHGLKLEPLEYLAPDCVFRIFLTEELCNEVLNKPLSLGCDALKLFPDFEGIAQFVASKADLRRISYDQELGRRIGLRLRERARQRSVSATHDPKTEDFGGMFGPCNFEKEYIARPAEAAELVLRLKGGPPIIFVTGEAGIGKTNFVLENLFHNPDIKDRFSLVFPLRLFESNVATGTAAGDSRGVLLSHLYEIMIGNNSNGQEQEAAREMVRSGAVIIALDGLDELARTKGEDVVRAVVYELESLVSGSPNARVIITCRHHIFERLQETRSLGRSTDIEPIALERFSLETMQNALLAELGCSSADLALLAETPLLYQMIRSARHHLPELLGACSNSTRLQEAWFKAMLEDGGNSLETLEQLGEIAEEMLKQRSDLVEVNTLSERLRGLTEKLSKPPFVLFIEERRKGTYAFSHQSLREFVLAWCVAKEIRAFETQKFALLKSSSSLDYEGHELYDRVQHLLNIETDVIDKLPRLLRAQDLKEDERNHLIRNLFEMLGELTPANDGFVRIIAEAARPYLKSAQSNSKSALADSVYITYKTRYNVARCLERIHWSAPRPYIDHIKTFRWWWNPACTPSEGEQHVTAYAVRGFHRLKQEATSEPPIVYRSSETPMGLEQLADDVSECLVAVIEGIQEREICEDAYFLCLNTTLALIRWLPKKPDLVDIERVLGNRHMDLRMRQNMFHALSVRFGATIPDQFRKFQP